MINVIGRNTQLSAYLREQINSLSSEIENAQEQQSVNDNECINHFLERYTIKLLMPEWQQQSIRHIQKELSLHELDPVSALRFGFNGSHNKSYQQDMLIYTVPCSGNLNLLYMAPSMNLLASLPRLQTNDGVISFEVALDLFNSRQTEIKVENYQIWFKKHIDNINDDLTQYNTSLRTVVTNLYDKKRQHADKISNILKNIGIPIDSQPREFQSTHCFNSEIIQKNQNNYQSVAISYGTLDVIIATQLRDFLNQNGVDTWFYIENSVPGEKLHRMMSNMVNDADRVILLCSKSSLNRPGVLNELERVLEREAREGGSEILIPIALDTYVFEEWNPEKKDLATQLRSRNIINWDINKIDRILSALIK